MANCFLDGPDELQRLEFMSRQQLLKEDKILRDKINNYVQLVNALTGQEVMLPVDNDEYSFESVSSEQYEDLLVEEGSIESLIDSADEDEWDYESVEDEHENEHEKEHGKEHGNEHEQIPGPPPAEAIDEDGVGEGKIENMEFLKNASVDDIPPPTPSQIIRKLKATLVYAGMEQIKLVRRKSVKRLGANNWSYDMAKRRLDRELKRIGKRKAYRDAIQRLPAVSNNIEEEKESDLLSPQPSPKRSVEATVDPKGRRLSGSVFVSLLKTLELSKKPLGSTSGQSPPEKSLNFKMSRSDQRLQAILQKHHDSLMNKTEKMHQSNSPPVSPPPVSQGGTDVQ
jgi:hypothetical protein